MDFKKLDYVLSTDENSCLSLLQSSTPSQVAQVQRTMSKIGSKRKVPPSDSPASKKEAVLEIVILMILQDINLPTTTDIAVIIP